MKTIISSTAIAITLAFAVTGCRPDGGKGCDGVDLLSGCFGAGYDVNVDHDADHDALSGANLQFARIESPVIIR